MIHNFALCYWNMSQRKVVIFEKRSHYGNLVYDGVWGVVFSKQFANESSEVLRILTAEISVSRPFIVLENLLRSATYEIAENI